MFIQRKKTPRKPGPGHDPSWGLTYWNYHDACWVDTQAEATGYHSKTRNRDLFKGLADSNPGDQISLVGPLP